MLLFGYLKGDSFCFLDTPKCFDSFNPLTEKFVNIDGELLIVAKCVENMIPDYDAVCKHGVRCTFKGPTVKASERNEKLNEKWRRKVKYAGKSK